MCAARFVPSFKIKFFSQRFESLFHFFYYIPLTHKTELQEFNIGENLEITAKFELNHVQVVTGIYRMGQKVVGQVNVGQHKTTGGYESAAVSQHYLAETTLIR